MCGLLDTYLAEFSRLNPVKDINNWTELSLFCSPAKPFLLLAILNEVARGKIVRNFIAPTAELVAAYESCMDMLPELSVRIPLSTPYYELKDSSFWVLKPKSVNPGKPSSVQQLRDDYYGAEVHNGLFALLQMAVHRNRLRQSLMATYFSPTFQESLAGIFPD